MSLADEFLSTKRNNRSEIERAIDVLKGSDLRDFITALHDNNVSPSAISKALANRGILVDPRRISEYRNNGGRVRYGLDGQRVSR